MKAPTIDDKLKKCKLMLKAPKVLHFWWFLGILLLHLCPISDFSHRQQFNTVAKTLPKHFPAYFFMLPTSPGLSTELRAKT